MRKILLTMLAVLAGVMLSYAESCSSGQGSLSYQISGCSEQSRACCSGTWCSWGTTSCASCNDTTQACSGNVSGACAGNRTRSVTGSCGSCSYSGWNDSGCSYTQSCTATNESRNCSGNVTNACGGTQTRTRSVTGSCGSCSYSGWGNWSGSCSYTQSCTATSQACSSVSSAYNNGNATRTVTGTCGSCSYSSWNTSNCDCSGCPLANGSCMDPCRASNMGTLDKTCGGSYNEFFCQCGREPEMIIRTDSYGNITFAENRRDSCTLYEGVCGRQQSSYYHSLEDCNNGRNDPFQGTWHCWYSDCMQVDNALAGCEYFASHSHMAYGLYRRDFTVYTIRTACKETWINYDYRYYFEYDMCSCSWH